MTKIEIDLKDLGLPTYIDEDGPGGSQTLENLIIEAAADKLIGADYEFRSDLRDKVRRAYSTKIEEKVEALIEEAFAAPIQRTSSWGEEQGEVTSVREIIRETLEKYMNSAVPTRDGYSTDRKSLTQLIDNEVNVFLRNDFAKHLKEVKGNINLEVQKRALAAAVAELSK